MWLCLLFGRSGDGSRGRYDSDWAGVCAVAAAAFRRSGRRLSHGGKAEPIASFVSFTRKALAGKRYWQHAIEAQQAALRLAPQMQEARQELERLQLEKDGSGVHQPGLTREAKSVK